MAAVNRIPLTPKRLVKSALSTEFGNDNPAAVEERFQNPSSQQNLRVQASRKGRKGKTVISGFQAKPETLATLLKQLKPSAVVVVRLRKIRLKFRATTPRSLSNFWLS